ncbi:hypothetical protein DL766_002064 [Monosporascus sp. MC13-8B]|uniref:C2H2-type domain-containing protein n=1 Tax=Monosporascus cannonballus TaxID=155416 RepID=A0ABY0HDW2_9PEZI|nr:hypothetical protein DL763_006266 [Monosporascus cannonballus]RYO91265.1 hypothetical protein DL762_002251 [Monosporascus cannonballus]RYP36402.1 hypothetical protein DL766_002064 [Monosporascus sp. MC13-8B]
MASEKGPVATEAPLVPSTAPQTSSPPPAASSAPAPAAETVPASASAPVSVESLKADAARATQSLKRHREATPTSPTSAALAQFNPDLSPSKAARLAGLTSRHSPAPLTGAAAFEDERRREEEQHRLQVSGASENPAYKMQSELMSAGALAMSRPQDAPAPSDAQSGAPTSASSVSNPETTTTVTTAAADTDPKLDDVSPQSAPSIATLGSSGAPVTDSPAPMDVDARNDHGGFGTQPPAQMEENKATSLSYPGVVHSAPQMPAPTRGMTMPLTPNHQPAPRSPNSKKHKCPYCETEFTRHHNLKSHLLTHSQEKPYVCQTCQMRFRRLHDLKRHSKLHTGEKPHVCPKCDRKFARGDALARHSKGPGGCVGRRSSMGSSFLGDEDLEGGRIEGNDATMTDVTYDGPAGVDMTEEERRHLSMVGMKVQGNATAPEGYTPYSRTYPPPGSSAGRLYPPNVDHGSASSNASHTPNTSISSLPIAGGSASMYPQNAITESPKPLSPGMQGHDAAGTNRQRSPSLTQFSQQHFARHQSDRQTPPGSYILSIIQCYMALAKAAPVPPSFTAADAARYAASAAGAQGNASGSQSVTGNAGGQQSVAGAGGASEVPGGPGQSGGSGDSSSNNLFATDHGIWVYVQSLEDQFKQLSERVQAMEATERTQEQQISYLTSQVTLLRSQLDAKTDTPQKID